jgi:nucleotide-binding universal stress UspA family protein
MFHACLIVNHCVGDPKDALVGKAEQLSSDLMIMGSRGMSGLKKAFMGSVSDYCVHHASCPVLIVRKPNH